MIENIKIKQFKSIVDISLDLGQINIIIGANGCGKTNILEAISLASAASQNKLDNEFLNNRGIRITRPEFMTSAFPEIKENINNEIEKSISLEVSQKNKLKSISEIIYDVKNDRWIDLGSVISDFQINSILKKMIDKELDQKAIMQLDEISDFIDLGTWIKNDDVSLIKTKIPKSFETIENYFIKKPTLFSFLTYSPEESVLRNSGYQPQIPPLGIRGEGLFQHLKDMANKEEGNSVIFEINNGLGLLDWFDEFKVPNELLNNEYKLEIGDRFLNDSLHYFDQRSTNEGFLYLLFYLTLFSSKSTPDFFAIDNIEKSFNPKLCTKLINHLFKIAKKNNKQVILTTHNPYVLDGLDLSDENQRLYVARRDIDGHTQIDRIAYKEGRALKLSEIWMKGYIGGLPDNF